MGTVTRAICFSVWVLGCRSGAGSASGDAAKAEPLTKEYRCFELPGASRGDLQLLRDGKRVAWTEPRYEAGALLQDLVALDLVSGQTQVLEKDVQNPVFVGDQLVFLRATDKTGASYTWKSRVFLQGAPVTAEDLDVIGLDVDAATNTLYFTAVSEGAKGAAPAVERSYAIWKLPLAGGAPMKVRDGFALRHLVEGGKTLVATPTGKDSAGKEQNGIVRLPAAGGEPVTLLASNLLRSSVVGDKLVFLPRVEKDKNPMLEVVPLAGGTPAPLPGVRPASRLLTGRDQVFVIDRSGGDPTRLISRTDGVAPLAPLAHLVGIDVTSAVMLTDGVTLAALVTHDTNADGELDGNDETDVCLVPTSATPSPLTPPTRKVPKRLASAWKSLEALAAGDLAGAKVRYLEDDGNTALAIEAEGEGPVELEALLARVKELGAKVSAATKDPRLGTILTWKKNDRRAAMLWDVERGAAIARGGAYSMIVTERSNFAIAADPKVTRKEDFLETLPISTSCSGSVSNLGAAPLDVTVECRGWSYDTPTSGDAPSLTKKTTVRGVAPGATAKYSIDLGATRLGFHKTEQHFFVLGKELPWFNEYAWKEAVDFIATSDRVRAATSYLPEPQTVSGGPFTFHAHHFDPDLIATGFNALPPERQAELAKLVWKEYAEHYKRTHGSDHLYDVEFKEGSLLGRTVRNGKLEPVSK